MLEQLRKSGASIFIYLIFGLLIVIFVINFAPNAVAARVADAAAVDQHRDPVDGERTQPDRVQGRVLGQQRDNGRQKVYVALEMLIRRELLAQAADERGLRVTGDLVDEEIKKGYFFLGGQRMQLGRAVFDEIDGEQVLQLRQAQGLGQRAQRLAQQLQATSKRAACRRR